MAKCRNNLNKNNILSLPADYFGWRSRRKGGQAFYYNLFMGEKPIKRISISILNAIDLRFLSRYRDTILNVS
jgi:hypothetical protein